MPRKPSSQPNDVELTILRALWTLGPSTVRDVHDSLKHERTTGYTSTLKMMQVMQEKGLLQRDDAVRPHIYRPAAPAEHTQQRIVDNMIRRVFSGSAKQMVLRAVASETVSNDDMAEIRKLLSDYEQKQKKKG